MNIHFRIYISFLLSLFVGMQVGHSQENTVGLLSYQHTKSFDGYNLIFPHNQPNVYIIDNCGELVHQWEDDSSFRPGNTAYITKEGLLYKAKRPASFTSDPIWAGGGGAILEIRDWDNELIWQYTMNDSLYRLHHDFSVMPNGNIIALAWELKTAEECLAAGRDTSTLDRGEMWPDWVFEINPENDEIVWEWHAWDHLIQDFDESKSNFGVVSENIGKIDVNYGRADGHPDWMHGNALDYNADLDQIMLSIPYFDEVWIIDHTTTTAEAASSSGGFLNKGGDLGYRWGNPVTYENGTTEDRKLFFQHDTHWINDHLTPAHPMYNKIALFNNRVGADFSTANIFNPPWDMYSGEYTLNESTYGPSEFEETISHPIPQEMYSTGLSSIQVLPNGNYLLTAGRTGYSFELTPDNEIVWEYVTPLRGGAAIPQGEELETNDNLTFRMDRYPLDFQGFDGKDLSSKGWLELSPDTTYCNDLISSSEDVLLDEMYTIYPNPTSGIITIEWDGMHHATVVIHNVIGQKMMHIKSSGGRKYLDISSWEDGIYFITIDGRYTRKIVKQ